MPTENELRELLVINERRLHELKKQKDTFGLHTPPHISMEATQIETKIDQLRQQLGLSEQSIGLDSKQTPATTKSSNTKKQRSTKTQGAGSDDSQQSSLESTEKKSEIKWWIPIVVALIGLAGVVFVAVWNNPPSPVGPSGEEMQPAEFEYLVRVQNDTGENLPYAQVTLEIGGRAPLDTFTDSNGVAVIFIDSSYAGKPGFLMIEKDGFQLHRQHIELFIDALPDVVRLKSAP